MAMNGEEGKDLDEGSREVSLFEGINLTISLCY
jgi:hypothetical protein